MLPAASELHVSLLVRDAVELGDAVASSIILRLWAITSVALLGACFRLLLVLIQAVKAAFYYFTTSIT